MTDRGQTQQDFVIGVSVFLLATFFVFSFVPTTIAPTGAEVEASSYVADRVVGGVVENVTTPDEANRLDLNRTEAFFATHPTGSAVRANYSVSGTAQVNVTLETLQGLTVGINATTRNVSTNAASIDGTVSHAGDSYPGDAGAAATRIVRFDGEHFRIAVRVW